MAYLKALAAGLFVVLAVALFFVTRDDIHQRGLLEAESVLAREQKAEFERQSKWLWDQVNEQEARDAENAAKLLAFDDELARLRARPPRAKRVSEDTGTARICIDQAGNNRLVAALSRYREAIGREREATERYVDAVGDFRIATVTGDKEAQRQVNSLMSCQGYVETLCRAGLCETRKQ